MRQTLDSYLSKLNDPDIYFLHGDMWHFFDLLQKKPENVLNCGIQEPNIVNIASGLAYCGKTVFVYGVAGMIIHRAYEQIKLNVKGWAETNGKIIFLNSGHNNCYKMVGRGHLIDDDDKLCNALKMPLYTPETKGKLLKRVSSILRGENGCFFIRFGHDDCKW
jgi:transketolase C-terminal domain/subunit